MEELKIGSKTSMLEKKFNFKLRTLIKTQFS